MKIDPVKKTAHEDLMVKTHEIRSGGRGASAYII